jgi:hypothetical protein
VIEELLERYAEFMGELSGLSDSEAGRSYLSSLRETMTMDEQLDAATSATVLMLSLQVASPSHLILSLN